MKFLKSYKYWISNFIGWILFALLMLTLEKYSFGREIPEEYIYYLILEGILCGVLGFMLSFIILYYIEHYFDIGNYTKKDVYKLIGIVMITQLLYHILLWPILDIPLNYLFNRGNTLSFIQKLTNVPHFLMYFLVWLFVVLTLKLFHHINSIKVKQLRLQANLKEAQLNTLKGQINPHFMFNGLNNIRGLMLEDVDKARGMLTNLSDMLRYSLTKNEASSIFLEEELEMVENYIEISKIQFEGRLQFETQIDPKSLDKRIPPMIIQILIENALKHGVSNLKYGGMVSLSTHINADKLLIKVVNSGSLKNNANTTKLGLQNIEKRLNLLYGDDATFTLSEVEKQVVANIKIPLV